MIPQAQPEIRSVEEQLAIDLQAYLFAADVAVKFSVISASFPNSTRAQLIEALVELEEKNIISLSARHNAVFEKAKRTTQNLKPLT